MCSDVWIILQFFLSKTSVQTVTFLLCWCLYWDARILLMFSGQVLCQSPVTEMLLPAPWHTSPFAEDCRSKCKSFILKKFNLSCFSWYGSYFLVQPRKSLPKSRLQIFSVILSLPVWQSSALIFESLIPSGLNFLYSVRRELIFIFCTGM